MKYILFILLMNGDLTTAEFNDERACEFAITSVSIELLSASLERGTPAMAAAWCDYKGGE